MPGKSQLIPTVTMETSQLDDIVEEGDGLTSVSKLPPFLTDKQISILSYYVMSHHFD